MNIVILGSAYPYRAGGITSFNERLARQFQEEGHQVIIYNFTYYYPSFLYPGKTQFSDEPAPTDIHIKRAVHSINPLNWLKVGKDLQKNRPDLIVVRYWLPFMGPALGSILRLARKNKHTKVVCIADNVIPHEKRPGDQAFTRYFMKSVDGFITMSNKVSADLKKFVPNQPHIQVNHPLYDNFGKAVAEQTARTHLQLPSNKKIILFFGFIRHYKGLDLLLDATKLLKQQMKEPFLLVVAGEFFEDSKPYLELIQQHAIADVVALRTQFIPNEEVKYYLCAADVLVQPYRQATQSGVTPLAYHFEVPMVITNVGGLPDLVPDGKVGLVAQPDPASIAEKIQAYFEKGKAYFLPALQEEKKKYAWSNLTHAIYQLHDPFYDLRHPTDLYLPLILKYIEHQLGKVPRKLPGEPEPDWFTLLEPDWSWRTEAIRTSIFEWRNLFQYGKLGWGQLIQANERMFEEGTVDCPGEVIVWQDTGHPFDPTVAAEISQAIYALKGFSGDIENPEEKELAEHLENGFSRVYGASIPESLSQGVQLFLSTVFFQRHHLPHTVLSRSYFPVLYQDQPPFAVAMVPYQLWPKPLLDEWLTVY